MSNKSTNFAIVSKNTLETQKSLDLNDYIISSALQTTLEFHELITIFSNKIQCEVPHSAYEYRNEAFDFNINNGIVTRHSISYRLQYDNQNLGELKLMRNNRFQPAEIKKLENLLVLLCYALKNATLYKQALRMAHTDPVTHVRNRSAFDDTIQREFQLAKRNNRDLSVIFLDIDHFKVFNDTYGHACGDFALSSVASWIKDALRGSDIVFRYGGEEFVVILSDAGKDGAAIIAERIRHEIDAHALMYGTQELHVTVSLGTSTLCAEDTVTSLVQRADNAMYLAKRNGRNQVQVA
jgi:diguanylate cyclase (GGDEF)-like protein